MPKNEKTVLGVTVSGCLRRGVHVDGADHVGYSPIHPMLKPRAGTTHQVLAVRYAEEEVLERCVNWMPPLPGDRVVEVGFY